MKPTATGSPGFLLLLVAVSAVGPLALNIFIPSMPGLASDFQASDSAVQWTLTAYLLAIGLSQLVMGPLSDRFGRRKVLIAGLFLFVAAATLARFAPDLTTLILARALQGAGGSCGIVLGRAIVRDLYAREKAASMIGYVTMGMAIAPMIGPTIGGMLDELSGWRTSFDLIIALGGAVLAAVLLRLPETNARAGKSIALKAFAAGHLAIATNRSFWLYALVAAFGSAMFFAFLGGAPFVTQRLMGLGPSAYGAWSALIAGGYALGNLLSGRFTEKLGPDKMILYGNLLALIAAFVLCAYAYRGLSHPLMLFGPMMLIAISNGMVLPSAIASAISIRPDLAGAASGLAGSFQMGLGAGASALVGALVVHGPLALVAMILVMAVLAFLAGLAVRLNRQR